MRAVVVCRYPVYRDALSRLVESAMGSGSVMSCASLQEVRGLIGGRPVDLILADIQPDDIEFQELKAFVDAMKPAPVTLFAALSVAEAQGVHDAGARGCIPKSAAPELVTAALKLVQAGGLYFSDFSSGTPHERGGEPLRSRLSTRQLEVLRLIEMGQTNKEIAKALGISVATVKLHVQAILNITGARNRTEAALRARGLAK